MRSICAPLPILAAVLFGSARAGSLDGILNPIDPDTPKWASVIVITDGPDRAPRFDWHHYHDSAQAVNFWPASTIKVYAVVAALEYLNELGWPTDVTLSFERQGQEGWTLDCARTMREMVSEVFRRSSNEDYTLLLRFVGVDRINTRLLVPERGFPHSALMRGYVRGRPYEYDRAERQRITLMDRGGRITVVEHAWSGVSYSKQRGATVISAETGNCTSTRELAECLRRIMFHEHLPGEERYNLTDEQLTLLRTGGAGWTGLENREAGGFAWTDAIQKVYPEARYFSKGGQISTHTLDLAYIEDPASGTRFIVALAAESGRPGTVRAMAERIALWIRDGAPPAPAPAPESQTFDSDPQVP